MPRIKWWHPVSQDFNRDPQVRELRKKHNDWMALVWIEMLSIGSRNDGRISGKPEQIAECLSHVSMMNRPRLAAERIINAMQFMAECGWIELRSDAVLILNYMKYNSSLGKNKSQDDIEQTSLIQYNTDNTKQKDIRTCSIEWWIGKAFPEFWKQYPRKVAKPAAERAWKKIKADEKLFMIILAAITVHKESPSWNENRFIPHPATWLNQKRWEDEAAEDVTQEWEPPEVRAAKK